MDRDEKLRTFLGAAGPEVDPECATSLLEMNHWDVQVALNMVIEPPPTPRAAEVRAPMRTNFEDTLIPSNGHHQEEHGGMQPDLNDPNGDNGLAFALAMSAPRENGVPSQSTNPSIQREPRNGAPEVRPETLDKRALMPRNGMSDRGRDGMNSKRLPTSSPLCDTVSHIMSRCAERKRAKTSASTSPTTIATEKERSEHKNGEDKMEVRDENSTVTTATWDPHAALKTQDKWLKKMERSLAAQRKIREKEERSEVSERRRESRRLRKLGLSLTGQHKEEPEGKMEEKDREAHVLRCLQTLRKTLQPKVQAWEAAIKTLHAYISNLAKNPLDTKFHKINTENKNFEASISPHAACLELLHLIGFRKEGSFLVMDEAFMKSKGVFLWNVLAKVDLLRGLK